VITNLSISRFGVEPLRRQRDAVIQVQLICIAEYLRVNDQNEMVALTSSTRQLLTRKLTLLSHGSTQREGTRAPKTKRTSNTQPNHVHLCGARYSNPLN
jgi:hypothetical protein